MSNLKPYKKGDIRAIENGRKGGLKSGEAKKEKRKFKEVVKEILNLTPSEEEVNRLLKTYDSLDIEDINMRTLIIEQQLVKALKGDLKACLFLLECSGEKPLPNERDQETILPIFNIEVVDNSHLEKYFYELEEESNNNE